MLCTPCMPVPVPVPCMFCMVCCISEREVHEGAAILLSESHSQSRSKNKIKFFFSGDVNFEANFTFFFLLDKRAKHILNHKLIITLCSPLVRIKSIQICYQLLQPTHPPTNPPTHPSTYTPIERVCCLLVLNLVSSTLPCIRRPRPRLRVLDVCGFV